MGDSSAPLLRLPRVPGASGAWSCQERRLIQAPGMQTPSLPGLDLLVFCSITTYHDQAERPEAKPQLVNPHCCQDLEAFLLSVKVSNQIPSNTFLIG